MEVYINCTGQKTTSLKVLKFVDIAKWIMNKEPLDTFNRHFISWGAHRMNSIQVAIEYVCFKTLIEMTLSLFMHNHFATTTARLIQCIDASMHTIRHSIFLVAQAQKFSLNKKPSINMQQDKHIQAFCFIASNILMNHSVCSNW